MWIVDASFDLRQKLVRIHSGQEPAIECSFSYRRNDVDLGWIAHTTVKRGQRNRILLNCVRKLVIRESAHRRTHLFHHGIRFLRGWQCASFLDGLQQKIVGIVGNRLRRVARRAFRPNLKSQHLLISHRDSEYGLAGRE